MTFMVWFFLGAAVALAGSTPNEMKRSGTDIMKGESLYADVVKYAELGPHRTATRGDIETARWITKRLTAAGYDNDTDLQAWKLRHFF